MSEWIEHDGRGLPVPRGTPVEVELDNGVRKSVLAGMSGEGGARSWDRRYARNYWQVIRYRIRRPRAMETIDRILADVPEREPA